MGVAGVETPPGGIRLDVSVLDQEEQVERHLTTHTLKMHNQKNGREQSMGSRSTI